MSVDQISAEEFAKLFHQYRRMLAPIFECDERKFADLRHTFPEAIGGFGKTPGTEVPGVALAFDVCWLVPARADEAQVSVLR